MTDDVVGPGAEELDQGEVRVGGRKESMQRTDAGVEVWEDIN